MGGLRSRIPRRVHPLQSLHSPTHSQVHCKKRLLPQGMASLWPLREEITVPITLAGLFPVPQPHFLRPSPLRTQQGEATTERVRSPASSPSRGHLVISICLKWE